jgi:polyisoprenoid-binding protein YceI
MMKKSLILFLMMSLAVFAYDVTAVDVKFTAFKTPAKKGVSGGFNTVEVVGQTSSQSVEEMLNGLGVTIATKSVNSGNETRDEKLVSSFFNVQFNHTITAKIVEVKADSLIIEINMNHKTVRAPMVYETKENTVTANGYIDLGDFGMLPSLQGINKACYELHEGKTWQDVEISFVLTFQQ